MTRFGNVNWLLRKNKDVKRRKENIMACREGGRKGRRHLGQEETPRGLVGGPRLLGPAMGPWCPGTAARCPQRNPGRSQTREMHRLGSAQGTGGGILTVLSIPTDEATCETADKTLPSVSPLRAATASEEMNSAVKINGEINTSMTSQLYGLSPSPRGRPLHHERRLLLGVSGRGRCPSASRPCWDSV